MRDNFVVTSNGSSGLAGTACNGIPEAVDNLGGRAPKNEDDYFDDRVFGKGDKPLDDKAPPEYTSNVKATGVAGRAKQFMPYAALTGFVSMVEEVAHSHDNIDS